LAGVARTPDSSIHDLPLTNGLLGAAVSGPNIPSGTTVLAITRAAVPSNGVGAAQTGTVKLSAAPTGSPTNKAPVPFVFNPNGNAILASGTDAAAFFTGSAINYTGSVQLERSFDGGSTWTLCNIGGSGLMAIWGAGTPVNFAFGEPEKQVLYRLNCTALSAGNINYRISTTGGAAEALTIPLLS
jgi:hypothetical protein